MPLPVSAHGLGRTYRPFPPATTLAQRYGKMLPLRNPMVKAYPSSIQKRCKHCVGPTSVHHHSPPFVHLDAQAGARERSPGADLEQTISCQPRSAAKCAGAAALGCVLAFDSLHGFCSELLHLHLPRHAGQLSGGLSMAVLGGPPSGCAPVQRGPLCPVEGWAPCGSGREQLCDAPSLGPCCQCST